MTVIANAKLNLYLDITGVREDGYHELETVMQSISLSDILDIEIGEGSGIELSCDNPLIPSDSSNIAYKAAERYLMEAKISAAVGISINKRIPSGAGMGGGSADAAAVLAALDRRFGALSGERLYEIAAALGADVPFCLAGGTKICKGIGERMYGCAKPACCFILVVMPDFTCPTGAAYRRFDEAPLPPRNALGVFVQSLSDIGFAQRMYNTFELLYNDSRIEDIKSRLVGAGAVGAMLTGSGAAVFGVFKQEQAAAAAAGLFKDNFTSICTPQDCGIIIV